MLFSTYKYYFLHTIKWVIFLLSILVTLLKTLMLFKTSYSNNVFKEPLSKEDEAKYIDLLFKKDKHARDILIEHNLRLVAHICKKYENTNVDNDDLISIGTIGLIKGIDSYSKEKGTKITTYCALNQDPSLLAFPNNIAAEALDFYDDLFDMPYPLPKLDQVAIPDFEAGAMENWGLVTYRESCLLANDTTSQTTREYIATVITHELSHQWFGNLVTMRWWDDL